MEKSFVIKHLLCHRKEDSNRTVKNFDKEIDDSVLKFHALPSNPSSGVFRISARQIRSPSHSAR
jgi:hypothetical protein